MVMSTTSDRTLVSVFDQYSSGEDYGFTKTRVPIALARFGDENLVSRSQARRVLDRINRFQEAVLDFSNVESIGQAFADEIFRVFAALHPDIHIAVVRANEQVLQMIRRAQAQLREEHPNSDGA